MTCDVKNSWPILCWEGFYKVCAALKQNMCDMLMFTYNGSIERYNTFKRSCIDISITLDQNLYYN